MSEERCETCGSQMKVDVLGPKWCPLCYEVAAHMKPSIATWVQAVAKKAAADALEDMRTELRRGYEP